MPYLGWYRPARVPHRCARRPRLVPGGVRPPADGRRLAGAGPLPGGPHHTGGPALGGRAGGRRRLGPGRADVAGEPPDSAGCTTACSTPPAGRWSMPGWPLPMPGRTAGGPSSPALWPVTTRRRWPTPAPSWPNWRNVCPPTSTVRRRASSGSSSTTAGAGRSGTWMPTCTSAPLREVAGRSGCGGSIATDSVSIRWNGSGRGTTRARWRSPRPGSAPPRSSAWTVSSPRRALARPRRARRDASRAIGAALGHRRPARPARTPRSRPLLAGRGALPRPARRDDAAGAGHPGRGRRH